MKTLKYFSKAIQFLTCWNSKSKKANQTNLELTNSRFGINLKEISKSSRITNSRLFQLYSKENDTLFI
ncbi:hypothetical protein [Flavobacterium luteum]|uniref:Uncharacterized protein n=1 Tax=Flavobacterium luteum TaxID=2026654 RepID=A0A7J5AA88_9FLAO|nr:hypothetical protein [Flavobacterium luteum]KAB1154348.1 hypothetical protein F6464_13275 [Flavobacterium luteum]